MSRVLAVLTALVLLPVGAIAQSAGPDLSRLSLPAGFHIDLFAHVPGARSLAVAADLGQVFVSTRGPDIYAVLFTPGAAHGGEVTRIKSGLDVANGIAWHDKHLYVAEQPRIVRFAGADLASLAAARPEVLFDALPDKRHHGWRYARFGPDGRLYVSLGAPCNVCGVSGLEGTIIRMDARGGAPEIFARGVRNPVGLDFQPSTGILYFTDNGVDMMGDDSPPDELNRAPTAGLNFGFPWYGGGADRTPAFMRATPPANLTFPVIRFGAHVAPLGVWFYRGAMFPAEFRGDAFVAQHGSWNRSVPDGYRVVRVRFDAAGRAVRTEPFIEGWLQDRRAWGRPVDVAELPDGSLLITDDRGGRVYRVTYAKP